MKIRFFTNIPSPYRVEFFNLLGEMNELEVIFEAEHAPKINKDWYIGNKVTNFNAVYLKQGIIKEKSINWKILKYVNRKAGVLVFTNYSYFTEMVGLFSAKLQGLEYVLIIDGGIINYNENYFKRKLKKLLISGAKYYLSPSSVSDEFLVFYGADRGKIHRYPFTSLKEYEVLKEPISIEEKKKLKDEMGILEENVILSVGQYIYRKGFDWMIKAYKDIDSNVGIYIIGGKPTKEYLLLKEKYKMNNLHFIEFQNKNSIINWYRLANLFVLPTREDIWGLVINEAVSQGLPVITTDKCGAGLEMIKNGENGFIVEVEDDNELIRKTKYLLENNTKDIADNNLRKSCIYTLENMVERTLEILKEID